MIIKLDWRICIGSCFLILILFYLFTVGGLQKYISVDGVKSPLYSTLDKRNQTRESQPRGTQSREGHIVIDKDEEERRREEKKKEERRMRRMEREREEEWKRRNFFQGTRERNREERVEEQPRVNGSEKAGKSKPIVRWSKPDKSRGERLCAQILSNIFEAPFGTGRLEAILNQETNQPLEIDVYNEELKVGLEYNGPQHYDWPNWTGISWEGFRKQIGRDEMKRIRCSELGIRLIEVPYTVKDNELYDYIIDRLQDLGVKIEFEE